MSRVRFPISIGLPVFNGERHLAQTLDCLLRQDRGDFELIISDNASTDGTAEICRSYERRDSRIRYFRADQNAGAAINYNRTFHLACGRYFKWAPHDDLYDSSYLRRCFETLEAAGPRAVLAYPRTLIIDEQGQPVGPHEDEMDIRGESPADRLGKLLSHRFSWCHPVVGLIRADALRKTGLIGSYGGSDHVLLAELVLHGEFHEIPERLFWRRVREGESPHLKASASPEEVAAWFDARNRDCVAMPATRLLTGHVLAIRRARLKRRERWACYQLLRTSAFAENWSRPRLWNEWRRLLRRKLFDGPFLDWLARAHRHFLPHRLWMLLSGIKRARLRQIMLALSTPSRRTHAALLEFVATCLSQRSDARSREVLKAWEAGQCEPQRMAALEALRHTQTLSASHA